MSSVLALFIPKSGDSGCKKGTLIDRTILTEEAIFTEAARYQLPSLALTIMTNVRMRSLPAVSSSLFASSRSAPVGKRASVAK